MLNLYSIFFECWLFFYFWPPLLIKIHFKIEFQINRVSKTINIIDIWAFKKVFKIFLN